MSGLFARLARSSLLLILLTGSFSPGAFTQPAAAPAAASRISAPASRAAAPANQNSPSLVALTSLALAGSAPGGTFAINSYVEIPYSAALNYMSSITIEAWVKRTDASRCETLVGNNLNLSYWLGFCNYKLRFYGHGSGSYVDSNASIPANVWTHVAVTYDGYTRKYYINGKLDTSTTQNSGIMQPNPDAPLGIGFDINTSFSQNYFQGKIQEVRIWNTVRTAAQIQGGMYQILTGPQPGLVAEWSFATNLVDTAGGHNGIAHDTAVYSPDSAIPHDIRIPQVTVTPTLDGYCDTQNEYANAVQVIVGGASAYLLHTGTDLWVCFSGLTPPTGVHDNWAAVYLDPNHTRQDPSQPEHLSLEVHDDNTTRARIGDGVGNYTVTTTLNGKWAGAYSNCCGEFPTRSAEFRIGSDVVGGWSHVIGLALAQHWLTGVGDDRLWPALAGWNAPSTWSNATLGGVGALRSFAGQVVYQPRGGGTPHGLPGVTVDLIGSDPGGAEALATSAVSGLDGHFNLASTDDFTNHRLTLDPYTIPRGFVPVSASAPSPAVVVDPRTLDYGGAAAANYTGIDFTFGDPKPYVVDSSTGPYFLIIAPQAAINAGALSDFVDFKARLGFQVEVQSVEDVQKNFSGATLPAKIRALELARRSSYGSRFRYVLLIGPHSVIPHTFFQPYSISNTDCKAHPGLPTDWYYADLTSSFDTNGNGCLADGYWSKPSKRAAGYTPDSVGWNPTVAVGRLPFSSPTAIKTALTNILGFEEQAGSFKRNTLLAASMMDNNGRCWNPPKDPSGAYTQTGCDHVWNGSTDGSYLDEYMMSHVINPKGYNGKVFYENDHPATGYSPAHVISPQPNHEDNIYNAQNNQNFGMVNLTGHGNGSGVYRIVWTTDPNHNGILEAPDGPPYNTTEWSWRNLNVNADLSHVTPKDANGSIFITASCSTGEYKDPNNFGATILSQGHGVAWVGGLETVQYYSGWTQPNNGPAGGMMDLDYFVSQRLLDRNLRVGDAFWQAMSQFLHNGNTDFSGIDYDLYGDPTMSYWGNPGQQSTLASWPMLRENAVGQGYSTLAGPGVPKNLWTYAGAATGTTTLAPSPVVSNDGQVIVAAGSEVDVLVNGVLFQKLSLDAPAYGTPAIAADGTIYVMDTAGKLYAFNYVKWFFCFGGSCNLGSLQSPYRARRWAINLGSAPLTSPIIGSDGMIATAREGGSFLGFDYSLVDMVRPDGRLFREQSVPGNAIGALAVSADQKVYASTDTGDLARIDFFCGTTNCMVDAQSSTANSTPPLLAFGSVYVGRANGTVIRKNTSLAQKASYNAGSRITAGPVIGPGGQILVGTQSGMLISLTSGSLSKRWAVNVGAPVQSVPAFSTDAAYVAVNNLLKAYDPFSGKLLWQRPLGVGTGYGSAAVGYGREVYVQAHNGAVVAFNEGWVDRPWVVLATPVVVGRGVDAHGVIQVQWSLTPPPPPSPAQAGKASNAPQVTPTQYLLQRSANGLDWEDVAQVPAGASPSDPVTYLDFGVSPGVNYMYRVQALDPSGAGNDSDFTDSQVVQNLPSFPSAPVLDSVTVEGADSLSLAWKISAGDVVSGFVVERSGNSGGPFTQIAVTTGATTTYTDTGLTSNTPYYYQVIAVNGTGSSGPSNVLGATTRSLTLPAPTNVTASLTTDGKVKIGWDPGPAGATAVIEVNPQGFSGFQPLGTASADSGQFIYDPGVPSNFGYRVKFVQGNAESSYTLAGLRVNTDGFEGLYKVINYLPLIK